MMKSHLLVFSNENARTQSLGRNGSTEVAGSIGGQFTSSAIQDNIEGQDRRAS